VDEIGCLPAIALAKAGKSPVVDGAIKRVIYTGSNYYTFLPTSTVVTIKHFIIAHARQLPYPRNHA
jgi:hypothetical protein